ncbi:hypothetical protein Ddye_029756 [Dipteronia dyeriana]|uniref:Ubiquitin-like protease family profile domain-containing protein n=1 Tax=Dipteronia dyeriana TaxID=168575 RepID=A0AAD9WKV5_9ROSI|nr:hypothetical protein Ddye_029756 [Dipteronia dyeriana]
MMPCDAHGVVTTVRWNVLQSRWLDEDLQMVLIPCNVGCRHWLPVTIDLILGKLEILDPWRQDVPVYIRKQQVHPLRWFLPSMLNDVRFHTARRGGRRLFPMQNKSFSVNVVSTSTTS